MILYAYLKHDSLILEGDSSFQSDGYKLIRADHPSNTKRGVSIQNCKGYIAVIYRSPSQNTAEFKEFLSDFEEILNTATSSTSLYYDPRRL